jgi:hypothetical protein
MRRFLGPVLLAVALAGVLTAPTLAARPERTPLELPPSIDLPAGAACPFDVTVDFLANRGKNLTFFGRTGEPIRSIGTGTLKIRVTNTTDADHPSATLNISGPVHTRYHADGSSTAVYGGRSISLYPPGTFVLTAGRAIVQLDANGDFVSVTNVGFSADVCAMIAG